MTADDTTLNNAGEVGREMAGIFTRKITETIDGFPAHANGDVSAAQQRAAIATMVANGLYDYAKQLTA